MTETAILAEDLRKTYGDVVAVATEDLAASWSAATRPQ